MIDFDDLEEARSDDELYIEVDDSDVPRGRCEECACRVWVKGHSSGERCHDCHCPTASHEDLGLHLDALISGFTSDRRAATRVGLPLTALRKWSPIEARAYIFSGGTLRPDPSRRQEEQLDPEDVLRPGLLVSVICPTMETRHKYHPLLYENYRHQNYEPRELVVIDTGHRESECLRQASESDPSVVYHWFPMAPTGLTVGMKRNLCCHLARGAIVVHFDDDDMYSPGYLDFMVDLIFKTAEDAPRVTEYRNGGWAEKDQTLIAATLQSWHVFDSANRRFKYYDVLCDHEMSWKEKKDWLYGWGFSYAYTRACWLTCQFPDVFVCEDNEFMKEVRRAKGVIVCADGASAGCSHTFHPKISTSSGENHGGKACGVECLPPAFFLQSLPLLAKAEGFDVNAGTRYCVAGSWTDWKQVEELQRDASGLRFGISIPVPNPPQVLSFQLMADGDWSRCFYPDPTTPGGVLGPWCCHGVNWLITVPKGFHSVNLCWEPAQRKRCLSWTFGQAFAARRFAIGSWSAWKSWDELRPVIGQAMVYRLVVVGLLKDAEFQVASDRSWSARYWPQGGEMRGPGEPPRHGLNWVVRKPPHLSSFDLHIQWDLSKHQGPEWTVTDPR